MEAHGGGYPAPGDDVGAQVPPGPCAAIRRIPRTSSRSALANIRRWMTSRQRRRRGGSCCSLEDSPASRGLDAFWIYGFLSQFWPIARLNRHPRVLCAGTAPSITRMSRAAPDFDSDRALADWRGVACPRQSPFLLFEMSATRPRVYAVSRSLSCAASAVATGRRLRAPRRSAEGAAKLATALRDHRITLIARRRLQLR